MSNGPLGYSLTTSISPYEKAEQNPVNVVFLPIVSDNESKYITAVTDNTSNEVHVENIFSYSEDPIEEEKKSVSTLDIGENPVAIFYIGSVTVVGLYILFCLLRKSK